MTTTTRQAHRAVLVLVLILALSIVAESRSATVSTSASPVTRDLNATLSELMRVTPATSQDLAKLQQQGGRLHWVTFWQDDKAQKGKMTAALQRNLQFAVPDLVHDAQASGGSLSTTFKLYRDLTAVCESLDSMLPTGPREGKTELVALTNDLSVINRLREELSSYIQRTAVSMDREDARLVSSGRFPKKVIVDDNIPEKPLPRKRGSSNQ